MTNGQSRQLNVGRRKYCQLTDDGRQFITVCPSQADTDETAESIELFYGTDTTVGWRLCHYIITVGAYNILKGIRVSSKIRVYAAQFWTWKV